MRYTRIALPLCFMSPLLAASACRTGDQLTAPGDSNVAVPAISDFSHVAAVQIANVEQLYAAVNSPANAGASLFLAPGIYALSATSGGGGARPNGGRLELQRDMSLYGVTGQRAAVTIDASAIPASSLTLPSGRTAPVRIGRGSNTIEWLTVLGNSSSAAGIATELAGTTTTRIRVAHVVSGGSSRGIDVRNVGAANAGRRIEAEVIENEFVGPAQVVGMTEGIRVANFVGANHGVIIATLSGNSVHGFQLGCIFANNRSSNAVIDVRSSGDRFHGNTLGCQIAGGLSQATTGAANSNITSVVAHGSQFVHNTAVIPGFAPGGISIVGGLSTTQLNVASHNTVSVALLSSEVSNNAGDNFKAYGAFHTLGIGLAGRDNHVTIELHGASRTLDVLATPSYAADPDGTNTVTVIR